MSYVNFFGLLLPLLWLLSGLPKIIHSNQLCKSLLVSKRARLSLLAQTSFRAEQPLQLVHADLFSPTTSSSIFGNKYFLLLMIIVVGCECTCSEKKERNYVHSRSSKDPLKIGLSQAKNLAHRPRWGILKP